MRDRFFEGRAAKREIAGLAPIFDRGLREASLGEMMGDQLRLGLDDIREFFAQGFGDAAVQDLPPALQEALVSRVLHQRVLEDVTSVGRIAGAEDEFSRLPESRSLRTTALRPIEAPKAVVCYVRNTSIARVSPTSIF